MLNAAVPIPRDYEGGSTLHETTYRRHALALGAGGALFEIWRTLVFLGIVNWTFFGKEVSFPEAQWGPALWAILLAAIWIYVAEGFWNVRAYAWSFGIFISIFTIIFGFFAVLGNGSTTEAETIAGCWPSRSSSTQLPGVETSSSSTGCRC
jgi:hypothetical protein